MMLSWNTTDLNSYIFQYQTPLHMCMTNISVYSPISDIFLYLSNNFQFQRNPMNYLLVNLAVADIMYAAFIAPRVYFKLASNHPDGVIGTVLCKFVTDGSVAWIGGASSIVTLTAIAIERYYAVMYPHGNKWKLSESKLKVSPNDKLKLLVFMAFHRGQRLKKAFLV